MWWLICVENGSSMLVRAETLEEAEEWWNDEWNPHLVEVYSHPYIYEVQAFHLNPDDYPEYDKMDLIDPE